jgi:hypothetical protein
MLTRLDDMDGQKLLAWIEDKLNKHRLLHRLARREPAQNCQTPSAAVCESLNLSSFRS